MSVVAKQVRDYMRSVGKNQNHFTRQPTNLNQKHNLSLLADPSRNFFQLSVLFQFRQYSSFQAKI